MNKDLIKDRLDPVKQKRTLILLFVLLAVFLVFYNGVKPPEGTEKEAVGEEEGALTGSFVSGEVIYLELADTDEERIRGLSGRDSLGEDEGLLFVFEKDGFHGIWMKDMNFAIDIIWLDEDFKVVNLKENASPESYPQIFRTDTPARYVLEISAGEASRLGAEVGGKLKLSGRI